MTTIGYATLQIIPSLDGVSKSIERQLDGLRGVGKSLGDSITKATKTAGSDAGEALAEGIGKGAKDAGKSVSDELTKSTKSVGAEVGKQVGDALNKGVEQGAKDAGKTVADEITSATKEAGKQVGQVPIKPKVTPKVDTKATKKEAQSIPQIIYEEANKAAKSNGYGSIEDVLVEGMDKAGQKAGQVLGSAIGDAIHDHLGLDLSDTFKDVDFASVLNNTLDRGLKASADDLATGLAKRLGSQLGDVIKGSVQDATGIDLNSVGDRFRQARGVIDQFRARDYVGGTGNAVNMLGQLGIPGAGVGADALDAFNTVDTGRQTVVDLLKSLGKDAPAAALAGPEGLLFAAALVAGGGLGLGASHLLGIDDPSRLRTDTSPERLGLPRVAAGPNQLPTPIIPVPGLPTDSRFPGVMPRMNTTDLPSFAPLDMPDDPKNPLGLQRIPTTVDTGGSRSGSANVEANQATVQTTTATVVASSISLGSSVMPSVPKASAPTSVLSPPSVTGPHPTVSTPKHGVVPVNPLDILAPTDKHADGGIVDGGMTRTATIQAPVGPAGLIQWAEPSTKGEAFIPLGGGERSKSIWLETGKRLGVITAFEKGGLGDAGGLLPFSQQLRQYVMAAFPQVTDVSGYRAPDGYNEHSSGRALDVMIPNPTSAQGKALGNQIAGWALRVPGVDRIMWQRQLIYSNGRVEAVADRGSPTQNHEDHVHIFIDDQAAQSGGFGPNTSATKPSASTQGAIDPVSSDQTGSAAPLASSGGGSGAELPSSFSAAAAMPLSQLGSTITGITGETSGGHSPGDFVTAAGEGVAGQVQSALGVFGVNDSPGWLQAASKLIGGIKVGDGNGNTLFDGSNPFGSFGSFRGSGMSAMPLAATSTATGTPPPDDGGNVHGARTGQRPGPTYNIRTATVEDAFLQAQRLERERAATKLDRF